MGKIKTICKECLESFYQLEQTETISSTCYICKDKRLLGAGVNVANRLLDNINSKKADPDIVLE